MSDVIDCICVLKRDGYTLPDGTKCDSFSFVLPNQDWHALPAREKNAPPIASKQPWQYEIIGERLHGRPSILDPQTGFHTAYDWNVAFRECPEGKEAFDFFFELNPELRPK